MNLLIVEERDLSPEREFTVGGDHAEHIFCILHAKPGDTIRAGILGGGIGTATVLETTRHSARLRLEDTRWGWSKSMKRPLERIKSVACCRGWR